MRCETLMGQRGTQRPGVTRRHHARCRSTEQTACAVNGVGQEKEACPPRMGVNSMQVWSNHTKQHQRQYWQAAGWQPHPRPHSHHSFMQSTYAPERSAVCSCEPAWRTLESYARNAVQIAKRWSRALEGSAAVLRDCASSQAARTRG